VLARNKEFQPAESIIVLVLFGIVLPLLAWFATRWAKPLNLASAQSGREVLLVLGLLIGLAIYLIHGPQAIDALLPRAWAGSPQIHFFVTMTKKLLILVLLPFAAFRILFGYKWRDFGLQVAGLRELVRSHLPVVLVLCAANSAVSILSRWRGCPVARGTFPGAAITDRSATLLCLAGGGSRAG